MLDEFAVENGFVQLDVSEMPRTVLCLAAASNTFSVVVQFDSHALVGDAASAADLDGCDFDYRMFAHIFGGQDTKGDAFEFGQVCIHFIKT